MLTFNAEAFFKSTSGLITARSVIEAYRRKEKESIEKDVVGENINYRTKEFLEEVDNSLLVLGAKYTSMSVRRLLERLDSKDITFNELSIEIREIDRRLRDELTAVKMFVLAPEKEKYFFRVDTIIGSECIHKFPVSTGEMTEAAKCLSLNRPTACVFHCMRAMERVMLALFDCLCLQPPGRTDRNWGSFIKNIRANIDVRQAQKPKKWRDGGDRDYFESCLAHLEAVRNPWRNATMHVDKTYTEEQAEQIFNAVVGFMQNVATGCDELGSPKCPPL